MIRKLIISLLIALLAAQVFSQEKGQVFTLDNIVRQALKNNPGLIAIKTKTEFSKKQIDIQKGKRLPSINLSSEYFLSSQYKELKDYQSTSSAIQLYQPVWQNGKIKSEIEWSKLGYEAGLDGFKADQNNLIYIINELFINYLRSNMLLGSAITMSKRFSITSDAANERLKLGFSRRSDLLKAQTEYSNSIYLATQFETLKNRAFQSILQISGLTLTNTFNITDSLVDYYDNLEKASPDSLFKLAIQYLPELQLVKKRIDQQELSIQIEKNKYYPEIGAFGSYNYLKTPVFKGDLYSNIGLSLKMDIFSGWRKKNQIAVEKIKANQLTWEEEDLKRQVYTEMKLAWLSLSEARKKIINAKMQIESSMESYKMINQQYINGLSSMLELIDAQYVDFRANQNYIDAIADYYLAIALLKKKTGLFLLEYSN